MKSIKSYKKLWKQISEHNKEIENYIPKDIPFLDVDAISQEGCPRLKLENLKFEYVSGANVKFINIDFYNVDFRYCFFTDTSFINCTFNGCSAFWCFFSSTNKTINNRIQKCEFINTDIIESYFGRYCITSCEFKDVDVRNCRFVLDVIMHNNMTNSSILNAVGGLHFAENCGENTEIDGMRCPEEGSFIGWKYVMFREDNYPYDQARPDLPTVAWYGVLVKLKIPEDAKRTSGFGRQCRADKVEVLGFYAVDGTMLDDIICVKNNGSHLPKSVTEVVYKVGEITYSDSFDDNRFTECSHGIHFFICKDDAVRYAKESLTDLIQEATEDDVVYTKLKETVKGYNDATNKDS